MVALKHSQMRSIDKAFGMEDGYVLEFSNRLFSEFFDDEFHVDIYGDRYSHKGNSKACRLRAFIETEEEFIVARVLRRLWEEQMALPNYFLREDYDQIRTKFLTILEQIEGGGAIPSTDAIERFTSDETLEELIAAINRDIGANKPEAAIDRLHTYCMKKFGHLLDGYSVEWTRSEPLHSRAGKYVKALEKSHNLSNLSRQIIKNSIGVFDKFNHTRNNDSLAHDNVLLSAAEARFIYDSVTALLRFIKALENEKFGS